MWVKFWSNKHLWISTSAIFRKIKFFQIPSSIRSIMSLTNDPPFFISDDPVTSCGDHGKTLFFGTLANFLYPTYFSIFSYKKCIISFWNTYLSCGKIFVINYFNVWPKKILNNYFFLDVRTRSAPLKLKQRIDNHQIQYNFAEIMSEMVQCFINIYQMIKILKFV